MWPAVFAAGVGIDLWTSKSGLAPSTWPAGRTSWGLTLFFELRGDRGVLIVESYIMMIQRLAGGDVMKSPTRSLSLILCGVIAALAMNVSAFAQHAGGGGHAGAVAGHGGAYGGYRGGGGWRGGYGWRGGWGWGYGPWGWGGLGLGLYFATLPLYYSTIWWDGIPYYYADNTYYVWDGSVNQYETVSPPPEVLDQSAAQAPGASELIAYPKNGQSPEQLAKDKFECHHWAVTQTGFDPTLGASQAAPAKRSDYTRAQAACLEGRGYSVK